MFYSAIERSASVRTQLEKRGKNMSKLTPVFLSVICLSLMISVGVQAAERPNILVIWGDDIGPFNISAYNMGMMGYRTPNIVESAPEMKNNNN